MTKDIRWIQRFSNYKKALANLRKFVNQNATLNELEEQGLIQTFEYTYELGWNTLSDFYKEQGVEALQGSRDAIQLAFKKGLVLDGAGWIDMLRDRNRSSLTYNRDTASQIVKNIRDRYLGLFTALEVSLTKYLDQW